MTKADRMIWAQTLVDCMRPSSPVMVWTAAHTRYRLFRLCGWPHATALRWARRRQVRRVA